MPKLNWLDTLFFGVRRVLAGGVELPERPALNFVGASVSDNPAENRIDVALLGSPIRRISPVVTVAVGTALSSWGRAAPRTDPSVHC